VQYNERNLESAETTAYRDFYPDSTVFSWTSIVSVSQVTTLHSNVNLSGTCRVSVVSADRHCAIFQRHAIYRRSVSRKRYNI